jgi:glycosyltransferase involved in cell wall biosynthesis
MDKEIRVCVFGLYAENEPRNQILLKGLEENNTELIYCNYPAKERRSEPATFKAGGLFKILIFYLVNYIKLMFKYLFQTKKHDIVLVLFPGYLDMFLIKLLSRKPVIYSAHISLYNALVDDRKLIRGSLLKWICKMIDRHSCRLANVVVLDTNKHIDYFTHTFKLPESKFKRIFIGADDSIFFPIPGRINKRPLILSYGKYVPLQGLEKIVDAARLLPNFDFVFIGRGQTKQATMDRAKGIINVEFLDWVDQPLLPQVIANADIGIGGQFGDSERAYQIISIKAFEMAAMGKPILIIHSSAMRELFTHEKDCYMCEPTPLSIASALKDMMAEPILRSTIGNNARELFMARCTPKRLGWELLTIMRELK